MDDAALGVQLGGQKRALPQGKAAKLTVFRETHGVEKLAGPGASPAALAAHQLTDGHGLDFPRALAHNLRRVKTAIQNGTL